MDNSAEQDVARLWELLQQLAEQTQHHRTFTANLHVQASGLKVRRFAFNRDGYGCGRAELMRLGVEPGDTFADGVRAEKVRRREFLFSVLPFVCNQ